MKDDVPRKLKEGRINSVKNLHQMKKIDIYQTNMMKDKNQRK